MAASRRDKNIKKYRSLDQRRRTPEAEARRSDRLENMKKRREAKQDGKADPNPLTALDTPQSYFSEKIARIHGGSSVEKTLKPENE